MIKLSLGVLFLFISSFTFSHLMMWFKGLFKLMIIIRLYDLINRLNCLAMKSKKTTQECQIGYYEFLLSSWPLYLMP